MKRFTLAAACIITVLLTACTSGTGVAVDNQTGSGAEKAAAATEEALQRKNPLFKDGNLIGRSNFPLSSVGLEALPTFLAQVELANILDLEQVAGTKKLNRQICESVFDKFRAENPNAGIKGEQCGWNLTEDGTFSDVDPLAFSLSDLDEKYLLLLIDEEGHGAPRLFTYLYDLQNGQVHVFSRPSLGEARAYYHDGILYFLDLSGYLKLAFNLGTLKPIPIENPPS